MHVLVTGARAPVALDLIRALGRAGHQVTAADALMPTLGMLSRYATRQVHLPAPRWDYRRFVQHLSAEVAQRQIDLIIPTCEEVFYLGMAHATLAAYTRLFCEPLDRLAAWHHKGRFQQYAAHIGVRTPRTFLLEHPDQVRRALAEVPRYLLKPAFSRFATNIITNCGPHANARPLSACQPTPAQPWLLQEFISGENICTYSILHAGHVTAHCAYAIPFTVGNGSGSAFVAVDGHATLEVVRALGANGFTGQVSLDFIRTADGQLYLLECNPRATSGLHLIDRAKLVGGLLDPQQPTWVEPAGRRRQLSLVVLPGALGRALRRRAWAELGAALRTPDVIIERDDLRPLLAQIPQVWHFFRLSRRKQIDLLAATTDDIEWNGDADL